MNIDYHIVADKHYYSVPYQLARQQVDVRLSAATVEVFHGSRRVASHVRSHVRHGHTTDPAHMPESHRRHAEWTPARITEWAGKTGPATAALVAKILESRPHPEQGYRAALGIIRLAGRYGAGPRRGRLRPRPAAALLLLPQRRVDPAHRPGPPAAARRRPQLPPHPAHDNVRGPGYYQLERTTDHAHQRHHRRAEDTAAARHGRRPRRAERAGRLRRARLRRTPRPARGPRAHRPGQPPHPAQPQDRPAAHPRRRRGHRLPPPPRPGPRPASSTWPRRTGQPTAAPS